MTTMSTISTRNVYAPFSGPGTLAPAPSHRPPAVRPRETGSLAAPGAILTAPTPGGLCDRPLEFSSAGYNRHRRMGTLPCLRCTDSAGLAVALHRFRRGEHELQFSAKSLTAFGEAWEAAAEPGRLETAIKAALMARYTR